MDILWQLLIGLIVGVVARFLMPGSEALPSGILGILLTALLGVAGAFVGAFIAKSLWADGGYVVGWVMSIVGAILLLLIARMIFGRSAAA